MPRTTRLIIAWLIVAVLWAISYAQIPVWRSDLALWAYAAQRAPLKPRPLANQALALILAGDYARAERMLTRAELMTHQAHVPRWDRADVMEAVAANRITLAALRALSAHSP